MLLESHGLMSVISGGAVAGSYGDEIKVGFFDSAPKGHLTIKNVTRGTTKNIPLAGVSHDTIVWTKAGDSPLTQVGDLFEVTFSGKCGYLIVGTQLAIGYGNTVQFSGSGYGQASSVPYAQE